MDILHHLLSSLPILSLSLLSLYILLSFLPNLKVAAADHSGLTPYPVVGHLPQFLNNRHRFLDWIAATVAASPTHTFVFRRPGGVRGIITADPANVEHILCSNFPNYPKGPRFASFLEDFLGRGIFNTDGQLWQAQRKPAALAFASRSLRDYALKTVRAEISSHLLPFLKNAAAVGAVVDLQDVLERFAFNNVCKVAFGVDPACLSSGEEEVGAPPLLLSGFQESFRDAANLSAGRFQYALPHLWKAKRLLNLGSECHLRRSISAVHELAASIIRSRKKELESFPSSSSSSDDLLSRFILDTDFDEVLLRDIVVSFILAGRDTTSSALTWFFYLVSRAPPEVEEKIRREIRSIRERQKSGGDHGFGLEELREMHYLHAAITEAMRLFPPVPMNSSQCAADDVLPDGTRVRRGWFVTYNAYAMGRMEGVWGEDCKEYRPERWMDGEGRFRAERSAFRFFPVFHGGPRMCLGKEMAYTQMKSAAASMMERFEMEVEVEEGTVAAAPEQLVSLTLRMKGGLKVRVREREN